MRALLFAGFLVLGVPSIAIAAEKTQQLDSTIYAIYIDQPKTDKLSTNGIEISYGSLLQGHTVASNGEHYSQWCQATGAAKDSKALGGAGFCTLIDERGDIFWVWLRDTSDSTNDWGVIGGTGKYVGATGGGSTKLVKTMPDGTLVFETKGTVTTR